MSALRRLVVVDSAFTFSQQAALLQALWNQPAVDVLLGGAPGQDLLAQIATQLASADYGALDLFGIGSPASLSLDGLGLAAAQLPGHGAVLAQIGAALRGGSISLYGSEPDPVGATPALVQALATATGVAVQAFDAQSFTGLGAGVAADAVDAVGLGGAGSASAMSVSTVSASTVGGVGGVGGVSGSPVLFDFAGPVALLGATSAVVGNAAPGAIVPQGNWGRPVASTLSAAGHADQVALLDLNGDGHLDLLTVAVAGANAGSPAGWRQALSVALGDGKGGFATPVEQALSNQLTQVRLADVDGDGRCDVVATGWSDWNQPILSVRHGNALGQLDPAVQSTLGLWADALAVGDLDGDGLAEVIVGGRDPLTLANGLQILPAAAAGGAAPALSLALAHFHTTRLQTADVNGDGRADVVALGEDALSGQTAVRVYSRDGAGQVRLLAETAVTGGAAADGLLAVADVTGDGRADLVLAGFDPFSGQAGVTVRAGTASGGFGAAVHTPITSTVASPSGSGANSFWITALQTGDLDGDGRADVVLGGFDSGLGQPATQLLSGRSDGHLGLLSSIVQSAQTDGITGLAVADIQHDGRLELAVLGNSLSAAGYQQRIGIDSAGAMPGAEDTVQTLVLRGTDVDGSIDHFIVGTLPAHGALYLDAALTRPVTPTTVIAATQNSASLYFRPDADWSGDTRLEFVAVDNLNAHSPSVALPIAVSAVNDSPVAMSPLSGQASSFFTVQQYLGYQSNVLQNLVSYAASHAPSHMVQSSVVDFSDAGTGGLLGGGGYWPAALAQGNFTSSGINDGFFARVTANFTVGVADTYSFRNVTDDGSFLLIDGQLVVNDPTYHPQAAMTGNVALTPGAHSLELYFFEGSGGAILELSAKSSTGTYQLMSASGGLFGAASAATAEDTAVALVLGGADVDGAVTGFRLTALPGHGTVYADAALTQRLDGSGLVAAKNGGATVYFKPEANWSGRTSLSFVAVDNLGANSVQAVTLPIAVNAANDPPVRSAAPATLAPAIQEAAATVTRAQLLTGWTDRDAGDMLRVVDLTADHGDVVANADGSFTITGRAGYTGPMQLNYGVSDGRAIVNAQLGYAVLTNWVASAVSTTLISPMKHLQLTGSASVNGTGTAADNLLIGNTGSNALNGLAGNDRLDGGAGNDTLNGGLGADTMTGGLGDDGYTVDALGDQVIEAAGEGTDSVSSSIGYTLGANVERLYLTGAAAINGTGNELNNSLSGNAGANRLDGGAGSDTLNGGAGADTMTGGLGDDGYTVDALGDQVIEAAGEGTDSVSSSIGYTLGANVERLYLTGVAAIDGVGNALNNILSGNAGANRLDGGAGSDNLNGGAGADTMTGGLGDDGYVVDALGDQVIEAAGEGTDSVSSSIGYTLGANVERLYLTGVAAIDGVGNALNNSLSGNAAANRLVGGAGSDALNGGAGADTMTGGLGDDGYTVDALGDQVIEAAGEGTDNVSSSITYTLGANVERLYLTGVAAIDGTGNELDNALSGNAAANRLDGGAGNDTLNGGLGADTMTGGLGDDGYTVDALGDQVIEAAGEGTDSVSSSIGYTLGENVERLYLTGVAAISGTGNALNNSLSGNAAANRLDGGAGNDILSGGSGADTLVGALGNDTLTGGADADRFELGSGGLSPSTNLDSIADFTSGQDLLWLDSGVMSGFGGHAQWLAAGQLRRGAGVTTAADADDHLIHNTSTGALYYDADGLGGSAAVQIAKLSFGSVLTAGDVWLS